MSYCEQTSAQRSQMSAQWAQYSFEPCCIVSTHSAHESAHSSQIWAQFSIPAMLRQCSAHFWQACEHSVHALMQSLKSYAIGISPLSKSLIKPTHAMREPFPA